MNIIEMQNLTDEEVIKIVTGGAEKLKNAVDTTVQTNAYLLYEDVNSKTGEVMKFLSLKSDGKFFTTNSPTVISSFERIKSTCEQLGVEFTKAAVTRGTSKNGREFLDIVIEF